MTLLEQLQQLAAKSDELKALLEAFVAKVAEQDAQYQAAVAAQAAAGASLADVKMLAEQIQAAIGE